MPRAFTLLAVLALAGSVFAQLSPEEATQRLKDRQKTRAATQPATRPDDGADGDDAPAPRRANCVVYVLDANASMDAKLPDARLQIVRAINGLSAQQTFNVIAYHAAKIDAFKEGPVHATPGQKQAAVKFLKSVKAEGEGDPTQALDRAGHNTPSLVWLISDGTMSHDDDVLLAARKISSDFGAKLNTAAFYDDTTDQGDIDFMWKLAHAARGVCLGPDGSLMHPPSERLAPPPPPDHKKKPTAADADERGVSILQEQ